MLVYTFMTLAIALLTVPQFVANAPVSEEKTIVYRLNSNNNSPALAHEQTIEVKAAGTPEEELAIQGNYNIYYYDTRQGLMVTYTADVNGYKVRYTYGPVPPPPLGVSVNALKTAAG